MVEDGEFCHRPGLRRNPRWNDFQRLALDVYARGEFAGLRTVRELRECGDQLFFAIMADLEGASTPGSASSMLEEIKGNIQIVNASISKTSLKTRKFRNRPGYNLFQNIAFDTYMGGAHAHLKTHRGAEPVLAFIVDELEAAHDIDAANGLLDRAERDVDVVLRAIDGADWGGSPRLEVGGVTVENPPPALPPLCDGCRDALSFLRDNLWNRGAYFNPYLNSPMPDYGNMRGAFGDVLHEYRRITGIPRSSPIDDDVKNHLAGMTLIIAELAKSRAVELGVGAHKGANRDWSLMKRRLMSLDGQRKPRDSKAHGDHSILCRKCEDGIEGAMEKATEWPLRFPLERFEDRIKDALLKHEVIDKVEAFVARTKGFDTDQWLMHAWAVSISAGRPGTGVPDVDIGWGPELVVENPDPSYRTAMRRRGPSVPARLLDDSGLLVGRKLDYGCGWGADADAFGMDRYDPDPEKGACVHPTGEYDTITVTYVLNALSSPESGAKKAREIRDKGVCILKNVQNLLAPGGNAYITVRRNIEGRGEAQSEVSIDLPVVRETHDFAIYRLRKGDRIRGYKAVPVKTNPKSPKFEVGDAVKIDFSYWLGAPLGGCRHGAEVWDEMLPYHGRVMSVSAIWSDTSGEDDVLYRLSDVAPASDGGYFGFCGCMLESVPEPTPILTTPPPIVVENPTSDAQYRDEALSATDDLSPDDVGQERFGDYVLKFEGFTRVCWDDAEEKGKDTPDIEKEIIGDWSKSLPGMAVVESGWQRGGDFGADDVFWALFAPARPNPEAQGLLVPTLIDVGDENGRWFWVEADTNLEEPPGLEGYARRVRQSLLDWMRKHPGWREFDLRREIPEILVSAGIRGAKVGSFLSLNDEPDISVELKEGSSHVPIRVLYGTGPRCRVLNPAGRVRLTDDKDPPAMMRGRRTDDMKKLMQGALTGSMGREVFGNLVLRYEALGRAEDAGDEELGDEILREWDAWEYKGGAYSLLDCGCYAGSVFWAVYGPTFY